MQNEELESKLVAAESDNHRCAKHVRKLQAQEE